MLTHLKKKQKITENGRQKKTQNDVKICENFNSLLIVSSLIVTYINIGNKKKQPKEK